MPDPPKGDKAWWIYHYPALFPEAPTELKPPCVHAALKAAKRYAG